MEYDFQRASMLKRVPAWMLDMILLVTVATGFLFVWSQVFNVTPHLDELRAIIDQYEEEYGGSLSVSTEEYEQMTDEEKAAADQISLEINNALNQDEKALKALETLVTYIFAMLSLSIICAYVILEFLIPLWLKNGQTLGKKCFGVALMRKDGVKVTPFMMFARTVLGKCTIETLIPVMSFVLVLFNAVPLILLLGIAVLLAQIIIPFVTRNKTAIHDLLACTVAVDLSSQMIFDSPEHMAAYHEQIRVNKASEAEG